MDRLPDRALIGHALGDAGQLPRPGQSRDQDGDQDGDDRDDDQQLGDAEGCPLV